MADLTLDEKGLRQAMSKYFCVMTPFADEREDAVRRVVSDIVRAYLTASAPAGTPEPHWDYEVGGGGPVCSCSKCSGRAAPPAVEARETGEDTRRIVEAAGRWATACEKLEAGDALTVTDDEWADRCSETNELATNLRKLLAAARSTETGDAR